VELAQYDILRKEKNKAVIWLETSADLTTARGRIKQIVSFWPGTYEVVERESQRIVATVGGGVRLRAPFRRTREYAAQRLLRGYAWLLEPSGRVADWACYKGLQGYARTVVGWTARGFVPRWLASRLADYHNQGNQLRHVTTSMRTLHNVKSRATE